MLDFKNPSVIPVGAGAAQALTGAGVHTYSVVLSENARITRLYAKLTVAVVSTGGVLVTFRRRPAFGSATGQTALGTLTIPAGTAADKVVYKDITPVNCNIGDQLVFDVVTAAAGGGAAGSALYGYEADRDPETVGNQSNLLQSV